MIVEGRLRGVKNENLDMYPFYADDRADVYGIKDHHSDFTLKLQGTSPWTPWHIIENVLALSPDGGRLVLISDRGASGLRCSNWQVTGDNDQRDITPVIEGRRSDPSSSATHPPQSETRHQFVTKTRPFSALFQPSQLGKARQAKGFRLLRSKLTR